MGWRRGAPRSRFPTLRETGRTSARAGGPLEVTHPSGNRSLVYTGRAATNMQMTARRAGDPNGARSGRARAPASARRLLCLDSATKRIARRARRTDLRRRAGGGARHLRSVTFRPCAAANAAAAPLASLAPRARRCRSTAQRTRSQSRVVMNAFRPNATTSTFTQYRTGRATWKCAAGIRRRARGGGPAHSASAEHCAFMRKFARREPVVRPGPRFKIANSPLQQQWTRHA